MRARLALAASGLMVELREVELKDKPAAMLQASPKGTVPVLVDCAGRVLEESLEIMLWALQQHDPAHWLAPETGSLETMLALIAQNDGDFKQHLDRYKYPGRYADTDALIHRTAGAEYLAQLDTRLQQHLYLFGRQPALADMAIAPFVRQFAQTDLDWFIQQSWPALLIWLESIVSSPNFVNIMTKYAKWTPGDTRVCFPSLSR
jgi:glutathione S-transferase